MSRKCRKQAITLKVPYPFPTFHRARFSRIEGAAPSHRDWIDVVDAGFSLGRLWEGGLLHEHGIGATNSAAADVIRGGLAAYAGAAVYR